MDLVQIAFYLFAALAIGSAMAVISVRNPVHAALFLVLTFFSIACTWIVAGAEFLGIALILVYVGAVMVLFLFVVMMLDIDTKLLRQGFGRYLPVGVIIAVVMLVEILTLIGVRAQMTPFPMNDAVGDVPNTLWLARALFTKFTLPFEIAAVILTVAVIAAVMLTLRRRPGTKHQNPAEQVLVRAQDRLRMVKVEPLRSAAPPGTSSEESNP
ncbi:NADH-quinone oxidoreductase subunit J [Lysobacter korlensis]|uniref:NADH-quinone oxidoreductase subunit J n=1 Tax=Lysobacter korlensis TaxID=553636 RepID=A0ABV6RQE6_9GAMM